MMTCREVLDFLMSYLDGDLPPDVEARFREHLAACPQCVDYLSSYELTVRLEKATWEAKHPPCEYIPEALIQAILAARRTEK
jgi:predicted anti-sigma-YlaC factor YlaD